jgi:hypothetical protein
MSVAYRSLVGREVADRLSVQSNDGLGADTVSAQALSSVASHVAGRIRARPMAGREGLAVPPPRVVPEDLRPFAGLWTARGAVRNSRRCR